MNDSRDPFGERARRLSVYMWWIGVAWPMALFALYGSKDETIVALIVAAPGIAIVQWALGELRRR